MLTAQSLIGYMFTQSIPPTWQHGIGYCSSAVSTMTSSSMHVA